MCANRAKLGRGFAWYGLRGADRADRVLESHSVNQKFVHMRTNFSVYRDEMNQGSISKYGTVFPNMETHLALVYCPSFPLQSVRTSICDKTFLLLNATIYTV